MQELPNVPVRPLSEFEVGAVKSMRNGEELIVRGGSAHLRMVGALRAGYQCLECHQVPRGTLLGAFTYRLSRDRPTKTTDDRNDANDSLHVEQSQIR